MFKLTSFYAKYKKYIQNLEKLWKRKWAQVCITNSQVNHLQIKTGKLETPVMVVNELSTDIPITLYKHPTKMCKFYCKTFNNTQYEEDSFA